MATWNIDASHTNVGFSVKHMMVSKVRGRFTGFEGTIEGNPEDLTNAKIDFKIDASTIHTNSTIVTIIFVLKISSRLKHIHILHLFQLIL